MSDLSQVKTIPLNSERNGLLRRLERRDPGFRD